MCETTFDLFQILQPAPAAVGAAGEREGAPAPNQQQEEDQGQGRISFAGESEKLPESRPQIIKGISISQVIMFNPNL